MTTLYDAQTMRQTVQRIEALRPDAQRQWGKMTVGQMLAHCCAPLRIAVDDVPSKQILLGKLLAPFAKRAAFGPKPFDRNLPTDASFRFTDARDLDTERARLLELLRRFGANGPAGVTRSPHIFFGPLEPEQWGVLMYKHTDHHLRQFGA